MTSQGDQIPPARRTDGDVRAISNPDPRFGDERLPSRFWARVTLDACGCWLWTGSTNRGGYGNFSHLGEVSAHRSAFHALVGPIPAGMHLDHLCRVRSCCNPAHLEPVTNRENARRGAIARIPRCPTCKGDIINGRCLCEVKKQRKVVATRCLGNAKHAVPEPGFAYCVDCRRRRRRSDRKPNRDHERRTRRANGLCIDCAAPSGKAQCCSLCAAKRRARKRIA